MPTTVFLVRNGETAWRQQRRLLGRRDIPLCEAGKAQAQRALAALENIEVGEIVSSPLQRAMQTAELFAERFGIDVARDRRLTDLEVGKWEGQNLDDVWRSDDFHDFVQDEADAFPGGEPISQVHQRVISSIEQALLDNDTGSNIVIVTHSAPLRIALAHYLGMQPGQFHRLRISPGSISVVRFAGTLARPRVMAINWGSSMEQVTAKLAG